MKIGNSKYELNNIYNEDCLEAMKQMPDKYFELAIVDPPYGLKFGEFNRTNKDSLGNRYKANKYHNSNWDSYPPNKKYFKELFRISKNQIIWGGNYFNLPPTKEFIFWYKKNPVPNFADGEFAWTSYSGVAKCFNYAYYGNINAEKDRIHPTQKPVALYEWLLNNYAKKGDKILDTHLGSASSIIACKKLGFEYLGFELDSDYFKSASERIAKFESQENLFGILNEQKQEVEQITLSLKDNKSVE